MRLEAAKAVAAPALCSRRGNLILAFTGTDRHVNILDLTAGPATAPRRLEQARTDTGPRLCSHRGNLILAFTDLTISDWMALFLDTGFEILAHHEIQAPPPDRSAL